MISKTKYSYLYIYDQIKDVGYYRNNDTKFNKIERIFIYNERHNFKTDFSQREMLYILSKISSTYVIVSKVNTIATIPSF